MHKYEVREMTAFGAVWVLLLFFAVIKNMRPMLTTLVLFSCVFQSANVFVIKGQGIGPQVITSAVACLYFLVSKLSEKKVCISKTWITTRKILVILFAYIILNSVRAGTLRTNILRIVQLSIYFLCFAVMEETGKYLNGKYVYKTLKKMSIFILVVGIVQVLATTNIISRHWLLREIFWNDSSLTGGEVVQFMWPYGSYFRFFSTYMEPSYFVGFSIGALFYFFNYKKNRVKDMPLIIALTFATILSFSSAGYGALLIAGIVYIALSREGKIKIIALVGGLCGFFILYFCFYNVLDSVVFSKMSSASAHARITWNLEAIQKFRSSPIWGVGYKNCRASSLFYTILAELGIVGFILYVLFILSIIYPAFTKRGQGRVGDEYIGLTFSIIGVIASQMVAVPDFDICTFWMWMYFLGLIIGRNNNRSQRIAKVELRIQERKKLIKWQGNAAFVGE